MDTDRWHCWGYTDHQNTLIISALMISAHVPSDCQPITGIFPIYM
ncbi:unnamed protein product [Staurois parvus]|uniref:NADH dehydrogenase subunit 4 n=1 Tax=Staurois parvus TaxID=386267 RepID=A0ABN9DQ36_9NEOB|nr:unnamed protein product [Staurois parvus]